MKQFHLKETRVKAVTQEPKDAILKVDKSRAAKQWIIDRKLVELAHFTSIFYWNKRVTAIDD